MKNKYFYFKLLFIVLILLVIILWGLFFFIPTNKYIYNSNKRIKDLKRIIIKYKRDKSKFQKTNLYEEKLIRDMQKKFKDKFYIVENKESMIKFYRMIYNHINYYENKANNKIKDLQITTESKRTDSPNRYTGIKNPFIPKITNLEEKTIFLWFNGPLKDVLNFINHITWSNLFISIKELEVSKNFKLTLNLYYINNWKNIQFLKTNNNNITENIDETEDNSNNLEMIIDLYSPQLLKRINSYIDSSNFELNRKFGKNIFGHKSNNIKKVKTSKEKKIPVLILNGIIEIIKDKIIVAIINDRLYKKGEILENVFIEKIEKHRVFLRFKEETIILTIDNGSYKEIIKRSI